MVQPIKSLFGRAETRTLVLLALLTLIMTVGLGLAQLARLTEADDRSVGSWDELTKRYLVFREQTYMIVPPEWYQAAGEVEAIMEQHGPAAFQEQPGWFASFDAGTLYIEPKSELATLIQHGTSVVIYEDLASGELRVVNASDGREEIAFKSLPWPDIEKGDTTARYLSRELGKRRISWQVTLKDQALAEAEAAELALLEDEGSGSGMMLMMGGGDDVWISAMTRMTNGLQLSLDYTESYSGQVWSAYSYDVQYCPITNSTGSGGNPQPPGTNDPPACTNCPTNVCDFETTNNFMGLEPTWQLVADDVTLTGATRTVWLDTRPMGLDSQTNSTHRFYGFGSNVDTDNDGLNDGYELFVSKTNPNHWDTDGDGLNDGWEVQHGLDPLSAEGDDGRDGDPDRDGWTNFEEIESGSSPVDRLDVPSYFAPGVMISEFVYLPASGKPQWIELFNANQHFLPIDLGDFRVQRTSNGVFETVYTIPTNTIIHPGDTLLIVGPGSGVTGDLTGTIDLEKPYDGTNSHTAGLRLIKPANAPGFFEDTVDACLYDSPDEFSLDPAGFDDYGYEIFAPFTFTSNSLVRKWPAEDRNVGGLEWRWTNSPTPHRAGQGVDPDQDGLTTLQEWTGSQNPFNQEPTDPFDADSDDDGLSDRLEMTNSPPTNPLSPDTDGDDFPWGTTRYTQDNQEAGVGTDPHNPDTDGDGLYDGWELALGLDPLDTDSDNDGTPDGDEDYDGDGVSNLAEQSANSNPANASQTTGGPYIVTHQHTKPNWSNGDDFGYNGKLTVTFSNLRSNQTVYVLLEEGGYTNELFDVSWQGAAQWHWTPARTGITSATARNGQNHMRLIVTDRSPPPNLQPANQGADVRYTVLKIDLVTPAGDPVAAPDDSGDGQNEFTYSTASPGVLTMNLKAHVTPSGVAAQIKDQCYFTVDGIGASTMAWDAANPGGKPTASGDDLLATVTFTGLPVNNTDFGAKKAAVYFDSCKQDEKDYEVYFPKQERNHPGTGSGTTPNWYYYWAGAAVPGYDLTSGTYSYADGGAGDYAQYNGNPNNPHYTIHGPASAGHEQYNSAGLNVDRKGIDTCAATLVHEKQHRQTDLDWLPGGAWFGKTDTDGDELPDDWEDAHTAQGFDKTKASSFTPAFIYGDDEEVWCEMNALGSTGDGSKDWANPGKQSKTVF